MITSELDSYALRPLRALASLPYQKLSREYLRAASRYPTVLRGQPLTSRSRQYLYEFPGDLTHYRGGY
jgi:hypothetical protein